MELIIAQPETLHPEIPAPRWATGRHLEDDGLCLVDELEFTVDEVSVSVHHLTLIDGNAPRSVDDAAVLTWRADWTGEPSEFEGARIRIADIPRVLAALQRLQAEVAK